MLTAEPDETGALSVRAVTTPFGDTFLRRSSFWPRPEVDSAVVALRRRRREPFAAEEPLLWEIVQTAFQQRRKMISNSLRPLGLGDELILILRQAGVDPAARAEMLSVEQFAKIAQIAYNRSSVGKHR